MVSPTAATFYLYKMFGSVLPSQALATPQLCFRELNGHKSCWTWPGSAPKPPRPSPEHSPEPCWTWPGSAPKPPGTFFGTFFGTFSGTFSGTLLNVTWLCTKASQTFSGTFGTFSGTSLNLTRHLHQCTPELFWAEDPISLRCWGKMRIFQWYSQYSQWYTNS